MGNLYNTILELCAEKGIRPGKLCTELGLSRGLITDLKMGRKKSVSAETAQKIAAFFGVSVGYLLGKEEKESAAGPAGLNQQLDGIDFALYGEVRELTDDQKRDVLRFVQFLKQQKD